MKFGKYLEEKQRAEWREYYVDYKCLKDLIKAAARQQEEAGVTEYSPRTTSLTVQRAMDSRDSAEEEFFRKLEAEVEKVGNFTAKIVEGLRERLFQLQAQAKSTLSPEEKDHLLEEAQRIGDSFLDLEKFVNLNYMAAHKILKKHDKNMPSSPCRQFYISHLHNQPWVQGNYSDLLMSLSNVYSELRGDLPAKAEEFEDQYRYSTTKYWVRMSDISAVKHHILQHLPVYQYSDSEYTGDSQLVNSVYLDNSSLEVYHGRLDERPTALTVRISWQGPQEPTEVSIERKSQKQTGKGYEEMQDRMTLPENVVVGYLEGEVGVEVAKEFWQSMGFTSDEVENNVELFTEVQKVIDSKQLKPMVRTQYMRTLFQIPFEPTVRIKLDTNICMIKENPEDGPSCTISGRWYRDPSVPIQRTEITRFPHAVLELNLALESGETTPEWVQELVESGMLTEIDRFSKHIHGTATLFPDAVQALPYWVDDESVRASMLSSAPEQSVEVAPTARDQLTSQQSKPRKGQSNEIDPLTEPLLGRDTSGLERSGIAYRRRYAKRMGLLEWWFSKPPMAIRPKIPGVVQQKIEPKTYFANERTFLSWLHMALTMGSISAAMLGFSATGSSKAQASHDVGLVALILLPVALVICGYALLVYYWRSEAIRNKDGLYYDDRRGPLALTLVVISALSFIFLVNLLDFIEQLTEGPPENASSSPQEWFKSTIIYQVLYRIDTE
ncbi:hypothetical protein Ndes2526B_g02326 [Nannochloris sp. 'desiccata']|nr:putative Vacuolar transporter chaperone 4 [Chlorella desiccata (nom. nud.)]